MTIVFKYGDRATTPGTNIINSSGITCWATVAMPYNYSKNFPDFMIFEVTRSDPRCPANTSLPSVINPGDRYPAYRLRSVGGPNTVPSNTDTDQPTIIPPHSEIWAVSGTFPPFSRIQPPVEIVGPVTGTQTAIIRDKRGLIGDLIYPTPSDKTNFANLGFPIQISRAPESFLGTGFTSIDTYQDYIFQYEVSCADYPGFPLSLIHI